MKLISGADKVLKYLRDGWELRGLYDEGKVEYFLARKTIYHRVHAGTFYSLFNKELIERFEVERDPAWRVRFREKRGLILKSTMRATALPNCGCIVIPSVATRQSCARNI